MNKDSNYWDWVSVNQVDNKKVKDEFKEILKEVFPTVENEINELFWVNAIILYFNTYCGASQHSIAKLFNLSQFGVSKRYRSSKSKLKVILKRPFKNKNKVKSIFNKVLPKEMVEPILIYYFTGVISITSMYMNKNVQKKVIRALEIINILAKIDDIHLFEKMLNYYNPTKKTPKETEFLFVAVKSIDNYLAFLKQQMLIGNFFFKMNDKKYNEIEENLCIQ